MERREFIRMVSLLGGAASLPGCCIFPRPANPYCLFEHHIPQQNELLIDSHAHIFNGSDVQVSQFVSQVHGREIIDWVWLRDAFGELLQLIAWSLAPSANREINKISSYSSFCSNEVMAQKSFNALRDEQFTEAIKNTKQAIATLRTSGVRTLESGITISDIKDSIPQSYDELFSSSSTYAFSRTVGTREINFRSLWRFVVEMFQYRFVSFNNYLNTYNTSGLKTDLTISHIVDYDWPLSKGESTASSIQSQYQVMGQISRASNGLVHSFVPYCPFRHVAHTLSNQTTFDPLVMIDEAINKYGALGVKLYPPMGFALYGNSLISSDHPDLWNRQKHLPDFCKSTEFPAMLDEALDKFYRFCIDNDLPLMAHSSPSNMGAQEFEVCFDSKYWGEVLNKYDGIRINFGHFGGFGSGGAEEINQTWYQIASRIRDIDNSSKGFVDTGYFSEYIDAPDISKINLVSLIRSFPNMASSINYGTDWKMLVLENNNERYLSAFKKVLEQINDQQLRKGIFGQNATAFLGLNDSSSGNRTRLDEFYKNSEKPHWFSKI